jgi:macrodomain Ter protein organizer (MatP/YcbG family)
MKELDKMAKSTKNINIEISNDCWKKLKMMSINKEITLQDLVKDILERTTSTKKFETIVEDGA